MLGELYTIVCLSESKSRLRGASG